MEAEGIDNRSMRDGKYNFGIEDDRESHQEESDIVVDFGEESFDEEEEKLLTSGNKVAIAQLVLRKSKKCAAKYLKLECMQNPDVLSKESPPNTVLTEVLDILLNPGLSIHNADNIKWLKWLISSGITPLDFFKKIEQFDQPSRCSLVWTADFMAYRCRTCSISLYMSLCLECFHNGNHQGHDYNMFKSQAGGACDCGNRAVMQPSGFCNKHNGSDCCTLSEPLDNLLILAKAIVPRLLLRFIIHCREHGNSDMVFIQTAMADAERFITFLQELCSKGAAMRNIVTEAFCNPNIYKMYTTVRKRARYYEELSICEAIYKEALDSIPFRDVPEGYEDLTVLHGPLVHNTFIEEFVFWTVKFEFPQKLVCLLLKMRPDPTYEDAFAKAFVQHYSRISVMLVQSKDTATLSHRVVHVSVQLFSDNSLAYRMTDSYHLLHVMILSLKKMMSAICRPSTLHDISNNRHRVVSCGYLVTNSHCYWPFVSDLNSILSFKNIAEKLISDYKLLKEWISFLALFQGMNNNIREVLKHVEYEPKYYYEAFSAELQACASPLLALITQLKDPSARVYSVAVLRECLQGLSQWFSDIGFTQPELIVYNEVSFHLPLHRCFALVLHQSVKRQGVKLCDVLPSTQMLTMMLVHPLRVQVAFYEILNDLWARNGLQIKGQAMTYVQCQFCNIMVDPDLYLLQIGAGEMPNDTFVLSIFERFHSLEPLCFSPPPFVRGKEPPLPGVLDMENKITMLESCLTFLAMITGNRHNIGLQDEEIIRLEMVSLICMSDKTHSQIMEHVTEKCIGANNIDFEAILNKVTKYCQPECAVTGTMKQGTYVPRQSVWEDMFDPIFTQLRALQKKDYQNALNRYKQYCRDCRSMSKTKSSRLWPPYRLPNPVSSSYKDPRRILSCRTFHAVLFVIVYKCLHEPGFSENLLSLAIYLLELTLEFQGIVQTDDYGKEIAAHSDQPMEDEPKNDCPDGLFYLWYSSDDIFINSTMELDKIQLKSPMGHNEEMRDERREGDVDMMEIESSDSMLCLMEGTAEPLPRSLPSGSELVPYREEASAIVPSDSVDGTGLRMLSTTQPQVLGNRETLSISGPTQYPALLSGSEVIRYVSQARDMVQSRAASIYNSRRRRFSEVLGLPSGSDSGGHTPSISLLPSNAPQSDSAIVQASAIAPSSALKVSRHSSPVPSVSYNEYQTVNESLISLLLKLHRKLSGRGVSYHPNFDSELVDLRIGDGPFFIAKILNKLGRGNPKTKEYILEMQSILAAEGDEEGSSSSEEEDRSCSNAREEKKRIARERQKRVMASFARKQKQFMAKNFSVEPDEISIEQSSDMGANQSEPSMQLYDCVICKKQVASTRDRPIGLVVFIQPTNVAGHCTTSSCSYDMPSSDRDRAKLRHQRFSLSQYMKEKLETLGNYFDVSSCYHSLDIGWEGGVHVQTCGHYLHLDCQQSYLVSLRAQEEMSPSVDPTKNEYLCPFCRQLANSVIPIEDTHPTFKNIAQSGDHIVEIDDILKKMLIPVYGPVFTRYANLLEDNLIAVTTVTFPDPSASNPFLFMFISSILRTNLEIELIQHGCSLVSMEEPISVTRRSSLIPLICILAFHAKIINSSDVVKEGLIGSHWIRHVWSSLTQRPLLDLKAAIVSNVKIVPMICRDPISILLHIVLLLPPDVHKNYFPCIILYIYRLVVVRAAVMALRSIREKRREKVTSDGPLAPLLAMAYNNLRDSPFFFDEPSSQITQKKECSINEFTCEIRDMCLGFLRIASILKSHMMDENLPSISDPLAECGALERYLGLWETCSVVNTTVMGKMCGSLIASALAGNVSSPTGAPVETQLGELSGVTKIWCAQIANFASQAQVAAVSLMINVKFHGPRLLNLPHTFEEIFQYYHHKKCFHCSSIPKYPTVCLVCGTLVCYKQSCCKRNNVYETVRHANECGSGTAMFLSITQSIILVIRGVRFGYWGCIHLDSYGEEDRDLKRGKPLYLSPQRYHRLEQQWLHHVFDHTPCKWLFHKNCV